MQNMTSLRPEDKEIHGDVNTNWLKAEKIKLI